MESEEIVIEPFSLSDIKCNASYVNQKDETLILPFETDGTQVKYLSAAMGTFLGSKRKREPSVSLDHLKQVHNWRKALLRASSQSDPWEAFQLENLPTERTHRHKYNALKKEWTVDEVYVKMQPESFARGAMRKCFRIKKLSNFSQNQDWRRDRNNAVAKCFIDPVERDTYFAEVKLQMDAKLWAEEFNRHNPPKKVDFFMMAVLEFVDRPDRPLYHVENFIEGHYVKYNSNSGFVLAEDEAQAIRRQTPQAFSHFTFERSGHEIMVVDIQGVGDLYTDPQIHTATGYEYGDGNLGTRGMALFFNSHVCNSICNSLALSPFDLAPSEMDLLTNIKSASSDSGTVSRGNEDLCVLPSTYQRNHLTEFLRTRSSSSIGSSNSISEDVMRGEVLLAASDVNDDVEDQNSELYIHSRSRLTSLDENSRSPLNENQQTSAPANSETTPKRNQRLISESSLTDEEDRIAFWQTIMRKARSTCVTAEMKARKKVWEEENCKDDKSENNQTGGSVLGQIHLDMAKYHEMQRFTKADQEGYDKEAALFHLRHAADCGNLDAIITMARVALQLPHDVLTDLTMDESIENTDIGLDYMQTAAEAGDRAAMVYLGKAYDSGQGLGTRSISWTEAARWCTRAISSMEATDEEGNFDGTMDDPPYHLLGRLAEMYRDGGNGITVDLALAADYFTQAADSAMAAMKGRLANKYYALAEEMNALIEDQ